MTSGSYGETDNNDTACQAEFGGVYRLAGWYDVVDFYIAGKSMSDFFTNLGIPALGGDGARSLNVSWDSTEIYSGTRHFFITRHDHSKPDY